VPDAISSLRSIASDPTVAVPAGQHDVLFVFGDDRAWDIAGWLSALAGDPALATVSEACLRELPAPLASTCRSLSATDPARADTIEASPLAPVLRAIADLSRARHWIARGLRPSAVTGRGDAIHVADALAGAIDVAEMCRRLASAHGIPLDVRA